MAVNAAKRVSIIGSGNWGSAIAKIAGKVCASDSTFHKIVNMYVYEEMIEGKKLTEIINTTHENVKYLPGHTLPENVVAVPDIVECSKEADLLIFVVPHQFLKRICGSLKGNIKSSAIGISLIKGIDCTPQGLKLISDAIRESLSIDVSVLMGANIANEVAAEKFCETTIGCQIKDNGLTFKKLLQTPNFRVTVIDDAPTVEICGALKNIVACGAGFVAGLGYGDNTMSAVIRIGLIEMMQFAKVFFPDNPPKMATFMESCGVADLITTCYGGRNRRVSEAFVKSDKSIEQLEQEMLNGQRLQGPETAKEVVQVLRTRNIPLSDYPMFAAVNAVFYEGKSVQVFMECLQNHPAHKY